MEYILLNGDCNELLDTVKDNSIDLLLTDPPYGIDYQSCRSKADRKRKVIGDKQPCVDFIAKLPRLLKDTGAALIFTRWDKQQYTIDALDAAGIKAKSVIIWDKCCHGMGNLKQEYGRMYESIVFAPMKRFVFPNKRPTDIIRVPKISPNKLIHPCQKPVDLIEQLINQVSYAGATVCDPFMGFGTTGIACASSGRRFLGIELDAEYFSIAQQRIESACGCAV